MNSSKIVEIFISVITVLLVLFIIGSMGYFVYNSYAYTKNKMKSAGFSMQLESPSETDFLFPNVNDSDVPRKHSSKWNLSNKSPI
jgi:hypothetical protein